MAASLTRLPDTTVRLTDEQAASLWEHLLARQGLAPHTRLDTLTAIADAAYGLHAARLPSPYGIALSRAARPDVAAALFTPDGHDQVVTVRCMRKTLHALPVALAGIAHAATLRFRVRDAARSVLNAGHTDQEIAALHPVLGELLADGPLHFRDLETHLAATGVTVTAARLALKTAWESGLIVYRNTSPGWNREHREFVLASHVDGLTMDHDRDDAITTLLTGYVDRYGPVTVRDATWWSGLSAADVTRALAVGGRPLITLLTPWASGPAVMFADRWEEFTAAEQAATGINLLAHEDTALKAYFQTRDRYLRGLDPRAAFNQIGEAIPTIISGGKVIGTWSWESRQRAVVPKVLRGRADAADRRAAKAAADRLTDALRAAWAAPLQPRAHTPEQLIPDRPL